VSGSGRRTLALLLALGALAPAAAFATRTTAQAHAAQPKPVRAPEPSKDDGTDDDDDDARPAQVAAKDVGPLLEQTFADKRFAFCHDAEYPLTEQEARWCPLLIKSDARCPTFALACARGPAAHHEGTQPPERSRSLSLPELPAVAKLVLWILLGAGLALLIGILARHAIAQRRPPTDDEPAPDPEPGATAPAARTQVETDVERLLALARAAAAAGDFGRAIAAAYAALLRKLEGAGLVRVEAHRTNGDHLRDLGQAQPELRPPVAAVVAEVERLEFGGELPTEERYRFVHDRVMGLLVQRLGPLLVLLGLVLGAGSCRLDRGAWDHSPSGRAGVMALLQKYGFETHERWSGLEKLGQAEGGAALDQLLLMPNANIDDAGWAALRTWIGQAGHTLIVTADRELPDWLGKRSIEETSPSALPLTLEGKHVPGFGHVQLALPSAFHLAEAGRGQPVLRRGPALYAVTFPMDDGVVYLLADDHLFTNAALLAGDNARFLTELLRPGGRRLELAAELTGVVSHDPVTSVRRGKLAPVLLQLTLLLIVFFVYKGARFGRAVDPVSGRRRAFAEHARALGLKYARGRATRYGLEVYGTYALERMRERLNLGPERSLSAIAEAIVARTGRNLGDVMRVLVQAREAASNPAGSAALHAAPPPPAPEDMVALRQLAGMLAQTGGSGERSRVERQV
jgi:hypothetical protein